jgi:hypothetical protein
MDIKTTDTSAYKFSASSIGSTANLNPGGAYGSAPAPAPAPAAPAPILSKKEQKAKDKADKKAAKKAKK